MLAEDELLIREMYQLFLQEQGYIVGVAADGDEALTVAKSFQPDLILLDIMMPKRDGLEVLKILRSDSSYGCTACKIVLLTNLGDDTIAERVKDLIDGYAIKAEITLNDLTRIIAAFDTPSPGPPASD